jgi:hypothetical protein
MRKAAAPSNILAVRRRGLHVRYSDPINGFEVGLKLEHASLLNVHSTKSTRLVGRQQGKALEVRGVSLYTQYRQMEPTRAAPPSPAPPQSSSPTPSLPPYGGAAASTEPLYLLQPIGAHATLYYGLGSELTVEVPLAAVELDRSVVPSACHVSLQIPERQSATKR